MELLGRYLKALASLTSWGLHSKPGFPFSATYKGLIGSLFFSGFYTDTPLLQVAWPQRLSETMGKKSTTLHFSPSFLPSDVDDTVSLVSRVGWTLPPFHHFSSSLVNVSICLLGGNNLSGRHSPCKLAIRLGGSCSKPFLFLQCRAGGFSLIPLISVAITACLSAQVLVVALRSPALFFFSVLFVLLHCRLASSVTTIILT